MYNKGGVIIRKLSSASSFFVTTPIYYVNANPHMGHLYSSVIADASNRWQKLTHRGIKFKFSTGTDEHGMKVQESAIKNKSIPIDYCNKISATYKNLAECFNVEYTDFIRTTDERHKRTVHKFWNVLDEKGHIYLDNYEGWYCVSDETFLTESQLKEIDSNGKKVLVSVESGHPVEWSQEKNYMFSLNKFQEELIRWAKKDHRIRPVKFQKIVLDMLDKDLPAISISRPSSRIHWGIPVPTDNEQTIYVWLDALVNYLTAANYVDDQQSFQQFWPPNLQVIGKDILKFHAIYWPAFLIAADLEPPHKILCHSHWTVNGEKMSKSKNNVICPIQKSTLFTNDGFRYFLLREGVAHSDGNYSEEKIIRILNSELADTLGNLLSRCCGKVLNPNGLVPSIDPGVFSNIAAEDVTKRLIDLITVLPEIVSVDYNDYNFYKAVDKIIATLHQANLFFESFKPWEMKKKKQENELNVILFITMETLRITGILLQPIIPTITGNLLDKLNVPTEERYFENATKCSWLDSNIISRSLSSEKNVLFKRIIVN